MSAAEGATVVEFIDRQEFSVPISRSVLRDRRLSFGARGLFAFLWDLPENWQPRISHLCEMSPDGRDAIRARLRELEALGAVKIEAIRDPETGRVSGKKWKIFSPDLWAKKFGLKSDDCAEERVFRSSVKPIIGKPDTKVLQVVEASPKEEAPSAYPASAAFKKLKIHPSGMECWNSEDWQTADLLAGRVDAGELNAAIAAAKEADKSPVPGTVSTWLRKLKKSKTASTRHAAHLALLAEQDAAREVPEMTSSQISKLTPGQQKVLGRVVKSRGLNG